MKIMPTVSAIPTFGGWKPSKTENEAKISQMCNIINSGDIDTIAISGHVFPDTDSIGACYAMAYLLHQKTGKPVDIYTFNKFPDRYRLLEDGSFMNLINVNKVSQDLLKLKHYDLAISVDTSDTNQMNNLYYNTIFKNAKHTFKIDHHQLPEWISQAEREQKCYADINLVDADCPSASELVMQFTKPLGLSPVNLPKKFNEAVYIGILGDTGGFNYSKSYLPYYDSYLLVNNGLIPEKSAIYMNPKMTREAVDLITLARQKVRYSPDGSIAYLYLDPDLNNALMKLRDTDIINDVKTKIKSFINSLKNVEGIKVTMFIQKYPDDEYHFNMRSRLVDVSKLAHLYNGNGHSNAASFAYYSHKPFDKIIEDIITNMQTYITDQTA